MASRSFHALQLRARDQFARSARWPYVVVLLLALFHVAVVSPFVETRRSESETRAERDRLETVSRSLIEVRRGLNAVREQTAEALSPVLERLVADLEHDLARLDATRQRHAAAPSEASEDAEGSDEVAAPPEPTFDPRTPPFELDNPDWIADIRDAASPSAMLAALSPLAEELIVQPRFFDLGTSWKEDALPRLEARLDATAGAIPRLRGRFPEARTQWEAFIAALMALQRDAGALDLGPPAAPFWWSLPAVDGEIELGLSPEIRAQLLRPASLGNLEAAAEHSLERFEDVARQVAEAKRVLGEPAGAGGIAGPAREAIVPMFPLFLGLWIGAAMLWRSQRLRELAHVTHLAIEHGGPPALQDWLRGQAQASAAGSSASAWRACVLQTLLSYFLAMSWIALAAVQLRQIPAPDRRYLMAAAIGGAAAVLLAIVHRLIVARRAIAYEPILPDERVEAPTSLPEREDAEPVVEPEVAELGEDELTTPTEPGEDADGQPIEARPLRR